MQLIRVLYLTLYCMICVDEVLVALRSFRQWALLHTIDSTGGALLYCLPCSLYPMSDYSHVLLPYS